MASFKKEEFSQYLDDYFGKHDDIIKQSVAEYKESGDIAALVPVVKHGVIILEQLARDSVDVVTGEEKKKILGDKLEELIEVGIFESIDGALINMLIDLLVRFLRELLGREWISKIETLLGE